MRRPGEGKRLKKEYVERCDLLQRLENNVIVGQIDDRLVNDNLNVADKISDSS
jgi:hypothetical protein